MNVIVSNKNQGLLNSLDIDVIKSINGEFSTEEIVQTFSNFFFNRMFLDITAIKDYKDISNIQSLSMNLDVNKVIFLLDNQMMADNGFLSKLISMGIYNFGNNKESLMYLYNHPNSYKDVAHIHQLGQNSSSNVDQNKKSKFFGDKGATIIAPTEAIKNSLIVGFNNATPNAGASTLIYLLKKELSKKDYTVAIEVNKNDFGYFNEKDMFSVSQNNLESAIKRFGSAGFILVDLNNTPGTVCDMVVYLIEPSIIKLNKMIKLNKNILENISGEKVVLNKSLLTPKDVSDFEFEAHTQILANIPPINDRADNSELLQDLINKLSIKK